jgi:hypothetical protein
MKTWTAKVTVVVGTVSASEISENPEHYSYYFKDLNNPTEVEVNRYFEAMQENLGCSNDGSERILNARLKIDVS